MATRAFLQSATFAEQRIICMLCKPFPPAPRYAGRLVVLTECIAGIFVGRTINMRGEVSPMLLEGIKMYHVLPHDPCTAQQLRRTMHQTVFPPSDGRPSLVTAFVWSANAMLG
jgi:hypothetical protein